MALVEKTKLNVTYPNIGIKSAGVGKIQIGASTPIKGARAAVENVPTGELKPVITDDANASKLLGVPRVGYGFEPYYA